MGKTRTTLAFHYEQDRREEEREQEERTDLKSVTDREDAKELLG